MNLQATLDNTKNLHFELSNLIEKCRGVLNNSSVPITLPTIQKSEKQITLNMHKPDLEYFNSYSPQSIRRVSAARVDFEGRGNIREGSKTQNKGHDEAYELAMHCEREFQKIKQSFATLQDVHLGNISREVAALRMKVSEQEAQISAYQQKSRIYTDYNSKLKDLYRTMNHEIIQKLSTPTHTKNNNFHHEHFIDKIQAYFDHLEDVEEELITPVVLNFQRLFCMYLNARKYLTQYVTKEKLEFIAPDPRDMDINSEMVKSELFLECCRLREELAVLQQSSGRSSIDGGSSSGSEDSGVLGNRGSSGDSTRKLKTSRKLGSLSIRSITNGGILPTK